MMISPKQIVGHLHGFLIAYLDGVIQLPNIFKELKSKYVILRQFCFIPANHTLASLKFEVILLIPIPSITVLPSEASHERPPLFTKENKEDEWGSASMQTISGCTSFK
jgi:hypothetical protein